MHLVSKTWFSNQERVFHLQGTCNNTVESVLNQKGSYEGAVNTGTASAVVVGFVCWI